MNEAPASDAGVALSWSAAPLAVIPFSPRCGFSLIADRRLISSEQLGVIGVVGGQLSYDDAANCSAPAAIESTSEAWYSSVHNLSDWRQGRDAPFSPRRSMQADDSFVTDDSLTSVIAEISEPQPIVTALVPGWNIPFTRYVTSVLHADKSVSLAGGIRYLEHRWDAAAGLSRTTAAELYADVWSCTLVSPAHDTAPLDCDWHHTAPLANTTLGPPFLPTGSLPAPVAHAASVGYPAGHQIWNARFGGVTSEAAVAAWTALGRSEGAQSVMQQPRPAADRGALLPHSPLSTRRDSSCRCSPC